MSSKNPTQPQGPAQSAARSGTKRLWRRIRTPLAKSTIVKGAAVSILSGFLRFVKWTTRPIAGSQEKATDFEALEPVIFALWHGQHLMAAPLYPGNRPVATMVSRSADAELNAKVVERFGMRAVRGSGGRPGADIASKGGARALLGLKKALDSGMNVTMIADIPHGKPRDAGQGIILLASLSGRPILPVAIATSRRKVIEKSWDKTTINLPFGRRFVAISDPIHVPPRLDEAKMTELRASLTAAMNLATERADRMVGAGR